MGQIFGYEGRIHEGMQLAIRKEAAQIFLSGSYLKAPSRWAVWTGKEALSKVCETIHEHRQEPTMHELFRKTAEALPLKYPLGGDTLALCDLRGCRTVADVTCIFLQRIVAEHLLREADRRLWSVARKQHGAVTPLCWGLSYVTCTCCCVGQYEQMVKFPLGGCACSPKHTSPSRTDLAKSDLKAAKQGVAALSALSVACHFRQSLRKLSLAFVEDEVHVAQMSLGVPGSGGSDRSWNWPEMKAMFGLRKRYQRRMEEREEELRERELQSHPLSEFRVVNPGAISSHKLLGDVPLTVGDVVLPIELHSGLWLEMTTGATCPMISHEEDRDEMLLRPTSNYWLARETMPIFPHPVDSEDEEDSGTQVDSETTFVFKPVQQEMLERGDLVRSSEAKLYPEFVAVEEKASDFIHIRTLDGKLIFTVSSEDDLLDFPLKTLKRKVFEHLKLSELVQLELVCASGGLEDSEKLSALKGQGSGPIEFFVTVTLERGLFAPWVPLSTGGFVRFYDRTLQPLLKPIRSPFLQEAVMDIDRGRLFFAPEEFPQWAKLQRYWKELQEEYLQLWQTHREKFKVFEGQVGWLSFPLKLWGFEIPEHLKWAPKAAEAMQNSGVEALTTFCYSVLEPGCHIRPHREHVGTSGVRAHLGLQIPLMCAVRVGANALTWREGQWTLFNGDRSHEVLNASSSPRAVLLIDFGGPVLQPRRWPTWIRESMTEAGVIFDEDDADTSTPPAVPGAVLAEGIPRHEADSA